MKNRLFCVLTGAVIGCALTASAVMAADVTTISEGKLKVATSPDFAPYEFYHIDENGEPQLAGSTSRLHSVSRMNWVWSLRLFPWISTAS